MYDEGDESRQLSYWPSVSDLFMTLFIVALVLLALQQLFQPTINPDWPRVVEAVGGMELSQIREPTNKMRRALNLTEIAAKAQPKRVVQILGETSDEVVRQLDIIKSTGGDVEKLRQQLSDARRQIAEKDAEILRLSKLLQELEKYTQTLVDENEGLAAALNDKPPIIKIAEGGKDGREVYRFASGKAVVSKEFRSGLREGGFKELATEILSRNRGETMTVDTLEIIGHTDGIAVSAWRDLRSKDRPNLDSALPAFLAGDRRILENLIPGSNNDLGLLRALAIKEEWIDFVEAHPERIRLQQIELRCYSAGQTVPEGIAPDAPRDPSLFKAENQNSRRIEIRLTKLR